MNISIVARLVTLSCKRAWAIAVAAIVLCVVSLFFVGDHFKMTTDTAELLSPNLTWRQNTETFEKAFPQQSGLIVVVIDGKTPELAEYAAERLTQRLSLAPETFLTVRRPDGGEFFDREGLLLLPLADVQETTDQLIRAQAFLGPLAADPSLRGMMDTLSTVLLGVSQGQASLQDVERPFGAMADTLEKTALGKPATFSWRAMFANKPLGPRDLRRFILVQPKLDYSSLMPGGKASEVIRTAATLLGLDAEHGVRVRLTGSVPLADEEFATLADRAVLMTAAMLLAVTLCLWLAVRSLRMMYAILATTLVGLLLTAAVGLALVGRFNLISVAFIPLFVGLGVDFGIQFCMRYRAELLQHPDLKDALCAAGHSVGAALALAAAAVAVGFFAFLPTQYIGVSELGVIAGFGMIIAFVLSVTLLPSLLVLMRPRSVKAEVGFSKLAPLEEFIARRRKRVLLGSAGAALVSLALLPFLQFDFNPLHLRSAKVESMSTLNDLMADPDRTPNTIDILRPSLAAATALADRLNKLPEVSQAVTLSSFVPDEQDEKLALISDASMLLDPTINPFEIKRPPSDAQNVEALRATGEALKSAAGTQQTKAAAAARRLGGALTTLANGSPALREQAADVMIRPLQTLLDQLRAMLQAEPLTLQSLPAELRASWVAPDGRARVQVFPSGNANDNKTLRAFAKAVRHFAPDAVGAPISIQEAAHTIVQAFIQAGVLSLVAITALLIFVLRRPRDVALTVIPILLTGLLTLASCVLIGQPINFANIIALPLLFGIGVAFNIYFVTAWRAGATHLLESSLTRAVLFSALTTGTTFGSLWLSSHPGTASMGKLLIISLFWTLATAIIFVPALLGPPPTDREGEAPPA